MMKDSEICLKHSTDKEKIMWKNLKNLKKCLISWKKRKFNNLKRIYQLNPKKKRKLSVLRKLFNKTCHLEDQYFRLNKLKYLK